MSEVHYFQRYSTKENFVTNNTLHLLMRIYHFSPAIFQSIIIDIVGEKANETLSVGPIFEQQVPGKGSTPDARIKQADFELLIETKLGDKFDAAQLLSHINSFTSVNKIMLGICKTLPAKQKLKDDIKAGAGTANIIFETCTFSELIKKCRSGIPEFNIDILDVIDDFERFCDEENLLEPEPDVMVAFPCSDTAEVNIRSKIYFKHKDKLPRQAFQYIGFYSNKSIVGIGRLAFTAQVEIMYNGVKIEDHFGSDMNGILDAMNAKTYSLNSSVPLNAKQEAELVGLMKHTLVAWGWTIFNNNSFCFMSEVERCNFKKTTPYPLQNYRYFNLLDYMSWNENMPLDEIAKKLTSKFWG